MKRLLIAAVLALGALATSPALAAWDLSRLSGPWAVPGGVVFVVPADKVTAALQPYAEAVPAGVPVLAGVPCKALLFTSEEAAKASLASYWTP